MEIDESRLHLDRHPHIAPAEKDVDRAKVAGILIEGHAEEAGTGRAVAVAVGIGVNCTNHPQDTAYPATDLGAFRVAADDLLAAISAALPERLAQWSGGRGFADVRADWLARAVGLGECVLVRLEDRELVGRFETIDAEGALVLHLHDDTYVTVAAGDLLVHATPAAATIG